MGVPWCGAFCCIVHYKPMWGLQVLPPSDGQGKRFQSVLGLREFARSHMTLPIVIIRDETAQRASEGLWPLTRHWKCDHHRGSDRCPTTDQK
jgi:hypothetical protein